jgi:hypothetical protein
MTGTVAPDAGGTLTVTASASVPPPGLDSLASNNVASDSDGVGINHEPVANSQSVNATEDTPASITLSASDQDSDPITFSIVSSPAHGTISGTGSGVTYTPASNYNGPDTFSVQGQRRVRQLERRDSDDRGCPSQRFAVANSQTVSLSQDSSLAIVLTGTDAENAGLTYAVVSSPAHGSLSGAGANVTYTPQAGFSGTDAFTFTVNDGLGTSAASTVSITVTPVNSAPVLVTPIADVSVTDQSTSRVLNLATTFSDANVPYGDTLILSTVSNSNPSLVTTSWAASTLTLGLAAGVSGSATITVRATDSHGLFAEDSFVVTITRSQLAMSIADASVTEVNSGTKAMSFVATLSGPAPATVTAHYSTTDGTAVAGADYNSVSGTLTFAAGTTSQTIVVNTLGDATDEDNETLHVVLSAPSGALILDGDGLGTIVDNDTSSLSINDVSVSEGNSGSVVATFTLSITVPNSRPVSVDFATTDGVAVAGADFVNGSGGRKHLRPARRRSLSRSPFLATRSMKPMKSSR